MGKYYAGIGSRQTPDHILKIMHHIGAYLYTQGWTLRSGAAQGADACFERGHDRAYEMDMLGEPKKEIYLPWAYYQNNLSDLHPKNIPFSQEEIDFTANYHPGWKKCSPSVRALHQRNTRIILGHQSLHGEYVKPVKFVVCWTPNGEITGGTGQTLRIAQALNIPIINLGSPHSADELEKCVLAIDKEQSQYV